MSLTLHSAISTFRASAKAKLVNVAAKGEPEDHLRAPLELLMLDLAKLCGLVRGAVATVGETAVAELRTRPDYAVTVQHTLVGFVELKAPGKGADPRRYKDRHWRCGGCGPEARRAARPTYRRGPSSFPGCLTPS